MRKIYQENKPYFSGLERLLNNYDPGMQLADEMTHAKKKKKPISLSQMHYIVEYEVLCLTC